MKTTEEWMLEIDDAIDRNKQKSLKYLYLINAEMTYETVSRIQEYCKKNGYALEWSKCRQCKDTYDIIIGWKLNDL